MMDRSPRAHGASRTSGPRYFGAARWLALALAIVLPLVGSGARAAQSSRLAIPFWPTRSIRLGHGDSSQQDALPVPGPIRIQAPLWNRPRSSTRTSGRRTSGRTPRAPIPNGRRVIWSNGLDRIVKVDFETFEVLATYFVPEARRWTEADAEASIGALRRVERGPVLAIWRAFRDASRSCVICRASTPCLGNDNTYYIADKAGTITAYADADPDRPSVTDRREGRLSGFLPRRHGPDRRYEHDLRRVADRSDRARLRRRDLTGPRRTSRVVRLRHSEGAEEKATRPTGYGWVRNGVAIDDERRPLHRLSGAHAQGDLDGRSALDRPGHDGAWSARYLNGWGHGTGATPSLMGFGDEDQFVVITDGETSDERRAVLAQRDPGGLEER